MTNDTRKSLFTRYGNPRWNSVQVYLGPSRITGGPIVVLVTGLKGSSNEKTGSMVQSYILTADVEPLDALRTGQDVDVCGGCIHRPKEADGETWKGRSCYVNVAQGPTSLWRAWNRGNVPTVSLEELTELTEGRPVRLGSYGDPAAVPMDVWDAYVAKADGWTGYTHQARNAKLRDALVYCQVSADSPEDAKAAREAGIGSFRVLAEGEEPLPFETVCPASEEAGKLTTCQECKMCSGWEGQNIVIQAHGIGASQYEASTRRPLSLPVLNERRATR